MQCINRSCKNKASILSPLIQKIFGINNTKLNGNRNFDYIKYKYYYLLSMYYFK